MVVRLATYFLFLLVLVQVLALSGCIVGDAPAEGPSFDPMRVGTRIEWTTSETKTPGQTAWDAELVLAEIGMGTDPYGQEIEAAWFNSTGDRAGASILYGLASKSFLGSSAGTGWPGWHCRVPHASDLLILLSGAELPTHREQQTVSGVDLEMTLSGSLRQPEITLQNDVVRVNVSFDIPSGRLDGVLSVVSHANWTKGCDGRELHSVATEMAIKPGSGEEVPFEFGRVVSPYEARSQGWPPHGDLATASFSLQRAAARLEFDPQYQRFSEGTEVWPVFLRYWCPLDYAQHQWEIMLVREDGGWLRACVVIVEGLEETPTEVVSSVQTGEAEPPEARPPVVDLQVFETFVQQWSDREAGELVSFSYQDLPPSGIGVSVPSLVEISFEDPQQHGKLFRCSFNGGTGAMMDCYHGFPAVP